VSYAVEVYKHGERYTKECHRCPPPTRPPSDAETLFEKYRVGERYVENVYIYRYLQIGEHTDVTFGLIRTDVVNIIFILDELI